MRAAVYIDSGAFIAFLVRSDLLHREVVGLFARPPRRICTSVLVVAETYGWFLHRLGEEAARTFRGFLDSLPSLEVIDTGAKHLPAVWSKLDALRGRKLSLVDASSLVLIREHSIARVWGTDHHLAIEGAEVIPGSALP